MRFAMGWEKVWAYSQSDLIVAVGKSQSVDEYEKNETGRLSFVAKGSMARYKNPRSNPGVSLAYLPQLSVGRTCDPARKS